MGPSNKTKNSKPQTEPGNRALGCNASTRFRWLPPDNESVVNAQCLAFSADGKFLAAGRIDGVLDLSPNPFVSVVEARPRFGPITLGAGTIKLSLTVEAGRDYIIQTSTNLLDFTEL